MTNRAEAKIYVTTEDDTAEGLRKISVNLSNVFQNIDKSLSDINNNQQKSTKSTKDMSNSFATMGKTIAVVAVGFGTIWAGFKVGQAALSGIVSLASKLKDTTYDLYKNGLDEAMDLETAKNGLAGIISSVYKIKKDGIELVGGDKFIAATTEAEAAVKRLQVAAAQSGASFKELLDAFNSGVGNGAGLGLTISQVEKFAVVVANAAKATGVQEGGMAQELNALLTGEVTNDAKIASSLGVGPSGKNRQAYLQALKKGGDEAYKYLMGLMASFSFAIERQANSLAGIFDAFKDGAKNLSAEISSGLSKELLNLKPIIESIFDKNTNTLTKDFDGLKATLQTIGSLLGKVIVEAAQKAYEWLSSVSKLLLKNPELLDKLVFQLRKNWLQFQLAVIDTVTVLAKVYDQVKKIVDYFNQTSDYNDVVDSVKNGGNVSSDMILEIALKGRVTNKKETEKSMEQSAQGYTNDYRKKIQDSLNNLTLDNTASKIFSDSLKQIDEDRKNLANLSKNTAGIETSADKKINTAENKKNLDKILDLQKLFFDKTKYNIDLESKYNELNYNNRFKTAEEFYSSKEDLMKKDFNNEMSYIDSQITAIRGLIGDKKLLTQDDRESKEKQLNELLNQRNMLESEYAFKVKDSYYQRIKEINELQKSTKQFKASIDEMLGLTKQASVIRLSIEIDDLNKNFANDEEMLELIEQYKELKLLQIETSDITSILDNKEQNLNKARDSNKTDLLSYYEEMNLLIQQRIDLYQKELDLLTSSGANESNSERVRQLKTSIDDLKNSTRNFSDDLKENWRGEFDTFFTSVIDGTKSVKDAFRDMINNITNYITKFAAQGLMDQLFNTGGSTGKSGGFGGLIDSAAGWVSGLFGGRATGGFVDKGKPYLVGEGGRPEIFVPNTSGYVMNASRTNDLMNSNVSSGTVNNYYNIYANNPKEFENSKSQILSAGYQAASIANRRNN